MNPTHIHLLLNHFPILGTLIGSTILLYSIIKKQTPAKYRCIHYPYHGHYRHIRSCSPVSRQKKVLSILQAFPKSLIHDHEEASEKAFWLMELTGLISLLAIILYKIKSAFASKAS